MIKRIYALTIIAAGMAGFLGSVASIPKAWNLSNRVNDQGQAILEPIEVLLTVVEERSQDAGAAVQKTRHGLDSIRLPTREEATNSPDGAEAAQEVLDRDVSTQLKKVQELVESVQANTRLISNVLLLLDRFPFSSASDDAAEETNKNDQGIQNTVEALAEVSQSMEDVSRILDHLQNDPSAAKDDLAQLRAALKTIENRLLLVEEQVRGFGTRIQATKTEVVTARENLPERTQFAAIAATFFLVCFAVTQIVVIAHGRSEL